MMTKKYKSGRIVEKSGIYDEFNKSGGKINEVTCVKNKPFPTSQKGGYFKVNALSK